MCYCFIAESDLDLLRLWTGEVGGMRAGFQPPLAVLPDKIAPVIVRDANGARSIRPMRWGFPPLPYWPSRGLTLIVSDVDNGYWRPWLNTGSRCLVPATSVHLYDPDGGAPVPHGRQSEEGALLPLFLAGMWRSWTGLRGESPEPINVEHQLFVLLAAKPNVEGGAQSSPTPVILTTPEEIDQWLDGAPDDALLLQRPAMESVLTAVQQSPLVGLDQQSSNCGLVDRPEPSGID